MHLDLLHLTLEAPIANGAGKIRVNDTSKKINGPACNGCGMVKVTTVDGVVLQVECSEQSSET